MDFYRKAAEKSDPFSAYKYSVLLYRTNEKLSRFWLEFSAFIGYPHAYLDAAKSYLERGEIDYGNHYSYLAASTDDTDAIVFLAERYFKGDGVEESQEYAKWYLDKLTFPPLYAFKLSFKLRTVKADEAPNISMSDRRPIAMDLIAKAKSLNLPQPLFYLYSFLFENGNTDLGADLGELYLLGCGTIQNTDAAIRTLTRAAATGNAKAYMTLGKVYYEGTYVERSIPTAIKFLENAGNLGVKEAYTLLGDIYSLRDFDERSIPLALSYYTKGSEMGDNEAKEKADRILDLREKFYREAIATANTDPKESFKNRVASAAMGHSNGKLLLAEAYAEGL